MTTPTSQQRVNPGFMVRKVFIVSVYFLGLAALAGGSTLFLSHRATVTSSLDLLLVAQQLTSIFSGMGVAMLFIGLVLWLLPGNAAAANVINQFYTALKNQDYNAAFQYLDPNMRTPQGPLITPSWFIEEAETNDSQYGRVIQYGLAGIKVDFGKRIYTLKVARPLKLYRTQLRVKKQGYDWKIMRFDRF